MEVREQHLVAGVQEGPEDQDHGRRGPRRDDELGRLDRHPVLVPVVPAQNLPELHEPLGMGVLGLPRGHGPVGRLLDHLGRVVVRLPDLQVDDMLPARSNSWARSKMSITRNGVISRARRDTGISWLLFHSYPA